MKYLFLLGLLALCTMPAHADDRAALANTLLVFQAADVMSTASFIRQPGTFERDPLARPFVHYTPGLAVEALGWNLLARNPHTSLRFVRLGIAVEAVLGVNNYGVLLRTWR